MLLHLVKPGTSTTFSEYVTRLLSTIDGTLSTAERSDIVWDEHRDLTVKLTRSTKKNGSKIKVRPTGNIWWNID